jgi:hypothetical protein
MYIDSHSLRSNSPRSLARATSRASQAPARSPSLRQALLLLLALLVAFGVSTLAAESTDPERARPSLEAVRVALPMPAPVIDGRLGDAAWATAPVATRFTQRRPTPGAPASQRTEVRVLYDDQAVYVAMRLYDDDPSGIAAQLARRDAAGIYKPGAGLPPGSGLHGRHGLGRTGGSARCRRPA